MEKQRWEESERRREAVRRSERRKSEKKEGAGARKGRKVAIHCVFPRIRGSGGSQSRLAKAAGAEPCGQMRNEKIARRCGAKRIWSKKGKTLHVRTTFGNWDVEKVHAGVARSAFPSQMLKTPHVQTFGRSDVVLWGWQMRLCTLSKVRQTWRFCSSFNYNHPYTTLQYRTLNYTTLHSVTPHWNYTYNYKYTTTTLQLHDNYSYTTTTLR